MSSLHRRLWLAMVASIGVLLLCALGLLKWDMARGQAASESIERHRLERLAGGVADAVPGASQPIEDLRAFLRRLSMCMDISLGVHDPAGQLLAASDGFESGPGGAAMSVRHRLADGRWLEVRKPLQSLAYVWTSRIFGQVWMFDASETEAAPQGQIVSDVAPDAVGAGPVLGTGIQASHRLPGECEQLLASTLKLNAELAEPISAHADGWGPGLWGSMFLLLIAAAATTYPVSRGLTLRLERLTRAVQSFGSGQLNQRVDAEGNDEVARLAMKFNAAAAQIETLVAAHSQLLANASHEFRSPLARLKAAVEMMTASKGAPDPQWVEIVHASITELDAIVEEVLLASRLEAGAFKMDEERVDLLGVVAVGCAQAGVELELPRRIKRLVVRGSERLLARALRNLLDNAKRYGLKGVKCGLVVDDQQVTLYVCDAGPGVPEPLREKIFEPFYRLPGHSETEGGVGLGLSLVRQIAEVHGGVVQCLPQEGGGCRFVLRLPASRME